jgi:D-tyrosyl-tRNA(Tyr) deacylase
VKVLIQRVSSASVTVNGSEVSRIAGGFLVLLGIAASDSGKDASYLAGKVARLRVFEDEEGRMNRSLLDTGQAALVVSQFTLLADTSSGNRPGFSDAAQPEAARELYQHFVDDLAGLGVSVSEGVFGVHMDVELVNDGPVTILLESR